MTSTGPGKGTHCFLHSSSGVEGVWQPRCIAECPLCSEGGDQSRNTFGHAFKCPVLLPFVSPVERVLHPCCFGSSPIVRCSYWTGARRTPQSLRLLRSMVGNTRETRHPQNPPAPPPQGNRTAGQHSGLVDLREWRAVGSRQLPGDQQHLKPLPPCVTFRPVVAPLRGPGRSPGLPFACCVGSLLSVGRCGRCSCWCRFRVRGAQ